MAIFANRVVAFVPVDAVAIIGSELAAPRPETRARARVLAASFLESLLALEGFDDFLKKRVNLIFCIAASF